MKLSKGPFYTGAAIALGLGAAAGALFGKQCRENFQDRVNTPVSLEEVVDLFTKGMRNKLDQNPVKLRNRAVTFSWENSAKMLISLFQELA